MSIDVPFTKANLEYYLKELAKEYIGKKCLFNMFNGSNYSGVLKELNDSGVVIDNDGKDEIINLEFVMRITEVPKNKNGEYKKMYV